MFRRPNKIIGIYLGQPQIETAFLKRGSKGRWVLDGEARVAPEASGSHAEQVRQLLANIKPGRRRVITFAIPRNRIFFRELAFPGLSADEAVSAVRMGIELHAHLGRDEIYFDVWELSPLENGSAGSGGSEPKTRLLLAYVERSLVDPVIDAVRKAGHGRSLGSVSPLSCGLDAVLRQAGDSIFPCSVLCRQEDDIVLSLHGKRGWEGSHSVTLYSQAGLAARLFEMSRLFPEPFGSLVKSPTFRVGDFHLPESSRQPQDPCSVMENISELCKNGGLTKGICAAGIGMKSYPEIVFQDKPRKKPFRLKIDLFKVLVVLVGAGMIGATAVGVSENLRLSARAEKLQKRIASLEKRINPLVAMSNRLEALESRKNEYREFTSELPDILDVLKDIAVLTPKDTWIRNFSLNKGKMRISAEGKSATATVSSLRKSRIFSQVKLVSSVTKTKNNMERFSVEIIPKKRGAGK